MMRLGHVVKPKRRAAIVALRNSGHSMSAIAKKIGISEPTVRDHLLRAERDGVYVSHEPVVNQRLEKRLKAMIAMWNTGRYSAAQVGEKFDLPRGSVCRIMSNARMQGHKVIWISPKEMSRRCRASRMANLRSCEERA